MKVNRLLPEGTRWEGRWACLSDRPRRFLAFVGILLCFFSQKADAQNLPLHERVRPGEQISYELFFKWGLLMSRAGRADLSFQEMPYAVEKGRYRYCLLFRTSGMFEKIYAMRDTIDCYWSPDMRLLKSEKKVNENNYYLVDDLTFHYSEDQTSVHSHRYTEKETKIDTCLNVPSTSVYDMLGATLLLRTLDWRALKMGATFPFYVVIGRDVVYICFRYTGQRIVERNAVKYRTRHFYMDIYDDAFTQSKEAAELWVGDDENRIPVKIRAKLKIGAAEVYYKTSSDLRHPLTSKVEVSAKK